MKPERKLRYKHLENSRMQVLESGFIGRRREIQQGIKALNGKSDKCALLITGTAGLGKSCLAGKLIERFKDHEMIVIHGVVTAPQLYEQFNRILRKKDLNTGLLILEQKDSFEVRLQWLFKQVLTDLPLIICLDDFEKNLCRFKDSWQLIEESLPLVRILLRSLSLTKGKVKLIITSRYPFKLEHEGKDIVADSLIPISLMGFRNADLDKKIDELEAVKKSPHKNLILETAGGNLRFLEWLDKVAKQNKGTSIKKIKEKLQDKKEEFKTKYLAEILANTQREEFFIFLKQASVFRLPVTQDAFKTFGQEDSVEIAVSLTLMEKETHGNREPVYWVTPVIRDEEFQSLSQEKQKELHQYAFRWYDELFEAKKLDEPEYWKDAVYHALAYDNVSGACKYGIEYSDYLSKRLFYKECFEMQKKIAEQVSYDIIEKAIKEKDGDISDFLNDFGCIYDTIGNYDKAIDYYNKALEIDLKIYGEFHSNTSGRYNNIGLSYINIGEYMKAIDYLNKASLIDSQIYNEQNLQIATNYNNLGGVYANLGKYKNAIDYYNKALSVDLQIHGEQHPDIAIRYNNLGVVYKKLNEFEKAVEYYNKALSIDCVLPVKLREFRPTTG